MSETIEAAVAASALPSRTLGNALQAICRSTRILSLEQLAALSPSEFMQMDCRVDGSIAQYAQELLVENGFSGFKPDFPPRTKASPLTTEEWAKMAQPMIWGIN